MKRVHELFLTQKRFDIIMKNDGYKEALLSKWGYILYFIQNSLCDFEDIQYLIYTAIHVDANDNGLYGKEIKIYNQLHYWRTLKKNAICSYNNIATRTWYDVARGSRVILCRMIDNYYNYICSFENLQPAAGEGDKK